MSATRCMVSTTASGCKAAHQLLPAVLLDRWLEQHPSQFYQRGQLPTSKGFLAKEQCRANAFIL